MIEFLVDVNLPYKFVLWHDVRFRHVREIDDTWGDTQIWRYTREKNLTIITKDIDFYNRIIASEPPPKIIHLKMGNMKLAAFREFMLLNWDAIEQLNRTHKLVDVYLDKIVGID